MTSQRRPVRARPIRGWRRYPTAPSRAPAAWWSPTAFDGRQRRPDRPDPGARQRSVVERGSNSARRTHALGPPSSQGRSWSRNNAAAWLRLRRGGAPPGPAAGPGARLPRLRQGLIGCTSRRTPLVGSGAARAPRGVRDPHAANIRAASSSGLGSSATIRSARRCSRPADGDTCRHSARRVPECPRIAGNPGEPRARRARGATAPRRRGPPRSRRCSRSPGRSPAAINAVRSPARTSSRSRASLGEGHRRFDLDRGAERRLRTG